MTGPGPGGQSGGGPGRGGSPNLADLALDALVYAPVGMAVSVAEDLPELVDKGRQRVAAQLTVARMVGQMAVGEGQRRGQALIRDLLRRTATGSADGPRRRPAGPGMAPARAGGSSGPASPAGAPEEHSARPSAGAGGGRGVPPAAAPATDASRGVAAPAGGAGGSSLAIPGYDALSASQVVQRLAGLSAGDLEAVRVYESANRGRRTILNRVAQLQRGTGS